MNLKMLLNSLARLWSLVTNVIIVSPSEINVCPRLIRSGFIGCEGDGVNLYWHLFPGADRRGAECHWRCDAFECLFGLAGSTGVFGAPASTGASESETSFVTSS